MYNITIKPKALNDIDNIIQYLIEQNVGKKSIIKFIDKITENINNIAVFSKIGKQTNNPFIIESTLRKVIVEKYIIS